VEGEFHNVADFATIEDWKMACGEEARFVMMAGAYFMTDYSDGAMSGDNLQCLYGQVQVMECALATPKAAALILGFTLVSAVRDQSPVALGLISEIGSCPNEMDNCATNAFIDAMIFLSGDASVDKSTLGLDTSYITKQNRWTSRDQIQVWTANMRAEVEKEISRQKELRQFVEELLDLGATMAAQLGDGDFN
jgi:hypothetical protein